MKENVFLSVLFICSVLGLQGCGALKMIESKPMEKVVRLDNKNQEDLYIRANVWMVEKFNDAESVIQFSDKANGIITGKYLLSSKGLSSASLASQWKNVYAIIKIQVKDNAAKITITPESFGTSSLNNRVYTAEQARADIEVLIDDFTKSIGDIESFDW